MLGQDPHGDRGFSKAPRPDCPARRRRARSSGRPACRREARLGRRRPARSGPLVDRRRTPGEFGDWTTCGSALYLIRDPRPEESSRMPEAPKPVCLAEPVRRGRPRPRRAHRVNRGRAGARRRRAAARSRTGGPRRAAPIGSRQATARCRALRPPERQRRPPAGRSAALAPAADAAAGRLLRALAARPYRALAAIVALAGLLVASSWLALDLRDTSTARVAANGRLARTTAALKYKAARIEALAAELRRLEQSASPTQASTAPAGRPDVRRPPAAREPPPVHRPHRRHG